MSVRRLVVQACRRGRLSAWPHIRWPAWSAYRTLSVNVCLNSYLFRLINHCQETHLVAQPQPSLFEPCEARPCPLQEDPKTNHEETPYRWENGDWGPCSASCLGGTLDLMLSDILTRVTAAPSGKQKAALLCREVATGRTVPWSQCDARTRPPQLVRQCNQHACPPVWQVVRAPESWNSCSCAKF